MIAAEISRFLASAEPEIICIKGRWGVGKTYAWRHFLKQAQQDRRISGDKYSYISLFGRNSLADLRNSVTENTVSTADVEAKPSPTSLDKATSLLRQGFQKGGFFASQLPQSNGYAQLTQRALYLFVRNTIVCLDDLERAGTGLAMRDVLGLASQLKDEKGCKVAILLNDEKLAGEAKDDFQAQLEKVAEVVIDFELSPEEAVDIALDSQAPFYDKLRANCIKLKLDNIRVIKKAERFCTRLVPLLANFDERVLHQAVHTAALACYAKYQPDQAPSFDYIRAFNSWDAAIRTVNGDKSEVNPHYVTIQDFGITHIDGLDEAVLSAVERGFFDNEQLQAEAKQINDNLRTGDMRADYHRAWELYRSSFATNEDQLADALFEAVQHNVAIIDPPNLNSVVSVLRELERGDKASRLIKLFIRAKEQQGPRYWDPGAFEYHGRVQDAEIVAAMAERRRSFQETVNPVQHLKKIGERDGWNEQDETAILQLSEADVAAILLSSVGEDLQLIVSSYRTFMSISNPSPNLVEICRRGKAALAKVADTGKLNAMRVQSFFYGVDLSN